MLAGPAVAGQETAAPITFAQHVAPIVFDNCSGCHRPGGPAPFSLLTYGDVKSHAPAIVDATRRRAMPPWKPEPGYGEFAGARRLSDESIALIDRWVAGGMKEGDRRRLPPAPQHTTAWRLGEPDVVLTMRPYALRAAGDDMYRHFVLPIPVARRTFVKAWELRTNTRVLHHATMEIDRTGTSRHLDEHDAEPGYEGLIAHTAMAPDGYFLDWAPGHTPYVAPDGMSFPIEKDSDLVLMLHLRPSGKPETVEVSVGFYVSDTPPSRVPALLRLTRQDLDIPAGDAAHVISSAYRLPVDVDAFTVQPHAHNLARRIEGFATLPDGTVKPLLQIKDWDFNWQGVYRYASPVHLPAGAIVTMRWTYDNSAGNLRNPNRPPARVTFGQRTADEMSELWFQVVPRNQADRDRLTRDLAAALRRENINGYETMLRADPDNAALHDDVAVLYAEAGDVDRVAAHFAETVRLKPGSAPAHYNLGTAQLVQKKREDARRSFQKAVELDPGYANAYRSLGAVLQTDGKADEALANYRRAIQLAPNDPFAHYNLGVLLQSQRKFADAIAQYREALRIDSNYADAQRGLELSLAAAAQSLRH